MYGLVFALLVLVIAGIYYHYNPQGSAEGFTSVMENPIKDNPQLGKILIPPISPGKLRPSPVDKVVMSEPNNALPSAPFRETGNDRPLPPNDPANTRTKYIRIRRAYEDLTGFFNNEAQQLQGTSDPAIQQPLSLAKSDLSRLQEELALLDRNQGLEPTLTEKDMLEVNSNLRYLQRESRLRNINNEFTEGFANMDEDEDEEFQDLPSKTKVNHKKVSAQKQPSSATTVINLPNKSSEISNNTQNEQPSKPIQKIKEEFSNQGVRAKVGDLASFNFRVFAELERISASGSTDQLTQSRIGQLEKIRSDVSDIIDKVARKEILEEDIPIFMSDIEQAYPILGDMTKPLPQLLAQTGLPPELQNLLPPGISPSSAETEKLIMKYVDKILNNTSMYFNFGVHYKPPHFHKDNLAGTTRINPSVRASKGQVCDAPPTGKNIQYFADARYYNPKDPSATPAEQNMIYQATSTNPHSRTAKQNTKPGHLDWEKKTKQICEAVRARGLNPRDFACPATGAKFSPGYGWRGHAKMVCSRLETAPESGTPQLVGCPPSNWVGWNLSY